MVFDILYAVPKTRTKHNTNPINVCLIILQMKLYEVSGQSHKSSYGFKVKGSVALIHLAVWTSGLTFYHFEGVYKTIIKMNWQRGWPVVRREIAITMVQGSSSPRDCVSSSELPVREQFWHPMECMECLKCVTSLVTKAILRVFCFQTFM